MSETRPNLVLVSIDSLRADHCGFLGDDRGLTPTMDELADDGVTFETAIAPGPQTFSSMPAVFTSHHRPTGDLETYPGETNWKRRLAAIDGHLRRHPSLPERLTELGYSTAGFSPNLWASAASGFDRGFDYFADLAGEPADSRLHTLLSRTPGVDETSKPVELTLDMLSGNSFFTRWQQFYDELDAVRRRLSEPYFLWVFLLDTHFPFLPTRTYRQEQSLLRMYLNTARTEKVMRGHAETVSTRARESMQRSYRDTVRSVDGFLQRIRSDLASDDPVMIVHSDHGESFNEHDNYGHHHRELYEENIHVPYVVSNASTTGTITEPTSLATIPDVALTIAREGAFTPESVADTGVVSRCEYGTHQAVRYPRFKYVEHEDEQSLFDLENDHRETVDVSDEYPGRIADSRARLARLERHGQETHELSRAARNLAVECNL